MELYGDFGNIPKFATSLTLYSGFRIKDDVGPTARATVYSARSILEDRTIEAVDSKPQFVTAMRVPFAGRPPRKLTEQFFRQHKETNDEETIAIFGDPLHGPMDRWMRDARPRAIR